MKSFTQLFTDGEQCRELGALEVCKDISISGINVEAAGPRESYQGEMGSFDLQLGSAKATAYADRNEISMGWGLSLARASGDVWLLRFEMGNKIYELNLGLTVRAGVGKSVHLKMTNGEDIALKAKQLSLPGKGKAIKTRFAHEISSGSEVYEGSFGYNFFIPSFKLVITDKNKITEEIVLPPQLSELMVKRFQSQANPINPEDIRHFTPVTPDMLSAGLKQFQNYDIGKELYTVAYSSTELSAEQQAVNEQFLQENGISPSLSPNPEEDRVIHAKLNHILSDYDKQAKESDRLTRISLAFNTWDAVGALGNVFRNEEMQIASMMGKGIFSFGLQFAETVEAFSVPFTLSALNPLMTSFSMGLNLISYFTNDDEALIEQREAEFEAVQSMFNALYQSMQEIALYDKSRFDYLEWQDDRHFTQTIESLTSIFNSINSGVEYLAEKIHKQAESSHADFKRLESMLKEHSLEKLAEADSLVHRSKTLTNKEFEQVISAAKFYLHQQASNPAFTNGITGALNAKSSSQLFGSVEIQSHLGDDDLFNQVGYLQQYANYLLDRPLSRANIANPYVWLKALSIYIKAILMHPEKYTSLTKNELDLLTASANNLLEFTQFVRKNLGQLFLHYEKARSELQFYMQDALKSFNAKNTVLGIDIHYDMDELARRYQQSENFQPSASVIDYFNKAFCSRETGCSRKFDWIDSSAYMDFISTNMQLNLGNFNKKILQFNARIPFEYILADKLGEGYIRYTFYPHAVVPINAYYPQIKMQYFVSLDYVHQANPRSSNPVAQVDALLTGQRSTYPLVSTDLSLYSSDDHVASVHSAGAQNAERIKRYFSDAVVTKFALQANDETSKALNKTLEQKILIEGRQRFAALFSDPLSTEFAKFNALNDKLNDAQLALMSFIKISIRENNDTAGYKLSGLPVLYSGNSVKTALVHLHKQADFSLLDVFLEDQSAHIYDQFKSDILAIANRSDVDTTGITSIENRLRLAIHHFQAINNLISNISKPIFDTRKPVPVSNVDHVGSLHEAMLSCNEASGSIAIDNAVDLDGFNAQGESPIDMALQCQDKGVRNRLLMQLVNNRAYRCSDPDFVAGLIQDILDRGRDILANSDYQKLLKANQRFCNYHRLSAHDTTKIEVVEKLQTNGASKHESWATSLKSSLFGFFKPATVLESDHLLDSIYDMTIKTGQIWATHFVLHHGAQIVQALIDDPQNVNRLNLGM